MNKNIDIEAWADELSNSKLDLIELLQSHVELLEEKKKINSHAPEGRNYTNAQYVNLLKENQQIKESHQDLSEDVDFYLKVLSEIDTHVRSTPEPIPYIVEALQTSLPEYADDK